MALQHMQQALLNLEPERLRVLTGQVCKAVSALPYITRRCLQVNRLFLFIRGPCTATWSAQAFHLSEACDIECCMLGALSYSEQRG